MVREMKRRGEKVEIRETEIKGKHKVKEWPVSKDKTRKETERDKDEWKMRQREKKENEGERKKIKQ